MEQQPTRIESDVRTGSDSSDEPVSTKVVSAVADARGVDPLDLDERLFDVVDPDALDALFAPGPFDAAPNDGRVTFTMAGCTVVVEADGEVSATLVEA